ncbi:hypothetical protein [Rosettibacter firmus]|uniref:hypothetical protein n=1 Tax=Rosettibacter firmus TaxID=3111522 RepID=UPI00336BF4A9
MIDILKNLFFISIIIWLLPAFRQRKNKLFFYFLILAISDPISILLQYVKLSNYVTAYYMLVFFMLLVFSINVNNRIKYKYFYLLIGLILLYVGFFGGINLHYFIYILLHWFIFINFLKEFIINAVSMNSINIFYLVLMFYELTIITKILNLVLGFSDATAFYFITSIFQIAFGLFFSIFREDKTRIALKSR